MESVIFVRVVFAIAVVLESIGEINTESRSVKEMPDSLCDYLGQNSRLTELIIVISTRSRSLISVENLKCSYKIISHNSFTRNEFNRPNLIVIDAAVFDLSLKRFFKVFAADMATYGQLWIFANISKSKMIADIFHDYSKSRRQSNVRLFGVQVNGTIVEQRITSVQDKTNLIVGNFDYPPFSVITKKNDEISYRGMEVNLVKSLAAGLDLDVRFQRPLDGGVWGDVIHLDNGTIVTSGLIGDVVNANVDVGIAQFFVMSHRYGISFQKLFCYKTRVSSVILSADPQFHQ